MTPHKPIAHFACWLATCCIASGAVLVKTINGVTLATTKTVQGVAKANVKSIGGVDNTGGGGGTDWTADATMKALYYMDSSPGINQDSKSTNHVDDAVSLEAPAASAGDKIQGDQSADFEVGGNDDGMVLSYANATTDFPCKGTGDGEVSFAGWLKAESLATSYLVTVNSSVQYVAINATGNVLVRFNGSAVVTHTSTATISTGTWYFIAGVYSDAANEIRLYIRAQGAGSSTWETSVANIATLDDATGTNFIISGLSDQVNGSSVDGLMDAWAVFNDKAFTQAELDGVFANGWDGNGW